MSREMIKTEIDWAGVMPKKWRYIQNRYLYKLHHNVVGDKWQDYQLLSLTTKGVKEKNLNSSGGKVPDSYDNYQLVNKGDMVFCLFDLDVSAVFSGLSELDGMITSAYDVGKPNNEYISNLYSRYWFQYVFSNRYYKIYSKNVRFTITSELFKSIKTPVPPLEEQEAIGTFLDKKIQKIDNLISIQEKQIEKIKEYKLSLITKATTKGISEAVSYKYSGNTWIGEIPSDWNVSNFNSIMESIQNGFVGPTRDLFVSEGVPYIQSLHIKEGKILFEKKEFFVRKDWADKKPKIFKDDLLIVQTGDIGQVAVVDQEYNGCNCHALIIVRLNKDIVLPEYLSYYFQGKCGKELLLSTKTGALLPHLNSGKIGVTPVVIPNIDTQSEIISVLDKKCKSVDELLKIKQEKINKLQEYKKSLIYEYVTGKKSVYAE